MSGDFHGAKATVFIGADLLIYQRDRGVRWPGYWDFPGGGRERGETPSECLRREVMEEFGLEVPEDAITWGREVPSMMDATRTAWFFVVHLPATSDIIFGGEGQRWALMPPSDVMILPNLLPPLRSRFRLWLRESCAGPIQSVHNNKN